MQNPDEIRRILGVSPRASADEIKRAFRKMAKAWHPDLFHNDPELRKQAEDKLRQIINAYREANHSREDRQQGGVPEYPDSVDGKRRKCSYRDCAGFVGPDHRCTLCMRMNRPESKRTPTGGNAHRSVASSHPYRLHLCRMCGRLNRVVEQSGVSRFLCWSCRNPLDLTGTMKALTPRSPVQQKAYGLFARCFHLPSLDDIKFLFFCASLSLLAAISFIGAAIMVWGGLGKILPAYLRALY